MSTRVAVGQSSNSSLIASAMETSASEMSPLRARSVRRVRAVSAGSAQHSSTSRAEAVTATVEVSHEGRVVARGSSALPSPDAAGKISGLSPIPVQKLQPGTYDVKVTVSRAGVSAVETTTITIGS